MAPSTADAASSVRAARKSTSTSATAAAAVSASTSTRQTAPSDPAADDEVEREPLVDDAEAMASATAAARHTPPQPRPKASGASSSSNASSPSAASSRSSSSVGLDRELFVKLEEVTSELDRLSRLSSALPETRELEVVQQQLRRAQRSSSVMVQTQRELLDKIERHERSSFRRYFQFNREQKVESLKDSLWARMSESASLESELQQLERKSDSLLEARRTMLDTDSNGSASSNSFEAAQLAWRMEELERERQDLVGCLLQTIPAPETQQLSTRIAMYVSEIRASESIQKQVERCAAMYRDALRNLQAALAILLSPTYTGSLKEFVTGPYIMAVEAGHQIEAASHVLQPEARRRYRSYAPDLLHVRPPKFPQAIVDFAKRARVNYDRKSSLSVEGTRKLHAAENVVVLLHRIVIQKLELLNQWRTEVEQDVTRATEAHRRAESRLHQQMSVLARSASA